MKSIVARVIIFFMLAIFIAIIASSLVSVSIFNKKHSEFLEEKLYGLTGVLSILTENSTKNDLDTIIKDVAEALGGSSDIRITVIKADGSVAADSEADRETMDNHLNRPEVRAAERDGFGSAERLSDTVNRKFLFVARKITFDNGEKYYIRTAAPVERILAASRQTQASLLIAAVFILMPTLIIILSSSFMFTQPIKRLKETSEKISSGDLTARCGALGDNEFGALGRSIDGMAINIERNINDLSRARDNIENILRSIRDGVIVVDSAKRVLLINDAATEVFHIDRRPSAGMPLLNSMRNAALNKEISKVLSDGAPREIEIETDPLSGATIDARIFPFSDRSDNGGAIIVARDITRLKKLETIRREFIENASHELRTPVTIIRGFVETLLAGASRDETAAERFLSLLDKESLRLMNLTEDILSLEKAERSLAPEDCEVIDAIAHLRDCAASFDLFAFGEGLRIETDFPSEPVFIAISRSDFRQIFVNLIDNAIKFTEKGVVTLKARREQGFVRISVSDTGIGIPAPDLERIFERFYRVDKSRSRERGGTGLGLSIVRHLVEKWQGSVCAESKPGAGSVFTVTLRESQ